MNPIIPAIISAVPSILGAFGFGGGNNSSVAPNQQSPIMYQTAQPNNNNNSLVGYAAMGLGAFALIFVMMFAFSSEPR